MGEEIKDSQFSKSSYREYYRNLQIEVDRLKKIFEENAFSSNMAMGGIEQEAWITNIKNYPVKENKFLLDALPSDLLSPELAQFNIELNVHPQDLRSGGLRKIHMELSELWTQCEATLSVRDLRLHMIGILPTVRDEDLAVENMSLINRYQALNEQVLKSRKGKPLRLDIVGVEHLKSQHFDVMLESAATSFQIHRQIPAEKSVRYYNAALVISAAMVALCANSPFLFGKNLWDETRIPLFEQAVETGGYGEAANGPIRRVTFGSGYARQSVFELFQENLDHYPILLPVNFDDTDDSLPYLRMHNGTIWRWNRPLIGFDNNNCLHLRIEHRVVSAGPTLLDEMANTAFFYGLQEFYANQETPLEQQLSFSDSKSNFYTAAQHGLNAKIIWLNGGKVSILNLLSTELLSKARQGLILLEVDKNDIQIYMDIIEARVRKKQSGAEWQKQYAKKNHFDMSQLAARYWDLQQSGQPVHEWSLD